MTAAVNVAFPPLQIEAFTGCVVNEGLEQGRLQSEPATDRPSIHAPVPATLESVALLNLNITTWPLAEAGRFTVVVTNPPELPVHAWRPPIGLPKAALIVALYPPR